MCEVTSVVEGLTVSPSTVRPQQEPLQEISKFLAGFVPRKQWCKGMDLRAVASRALTRLDSWNACGPVTRTLSLR